MLYSTSLAGYALRTVLLWPASPGQAVTHFDSIPDLVQKIASPETDFEKLHLGMMRFNAKTYAVSVGLWRKVVDGLLDGTEVVHEEWETRCFL